MGVSAWCLALWCVVAKGDEGGRLRARKGTEGGGLWGKEVNKCVCVACHNPSKNWMEISNWA